MTTETEVESTGAYLQFKIPGLEYSAVRVPITADARGTAAEIEAALKTAKWFLAKYAETFPQAVNEAGRAQEARRDAPRPSAPRAAARKHSGLYCPEHTDAHGEPIALIESAAQFQEYDEGPNGEQMPAKFFCPGKDNGTGKNHSVWRSRAIVGEEVSPF